METTKSTTSTGATALPENIEAIYPLTPVQKALLYHTMASPVVSGMYFQQLTWIIRTGLDTALFREAWNRVVHRHPVLRTFFLWEGRTEPVQCVCQRVRIPWAEEDWRAESATPARTESHLAADRRRGFRLNEGPLLRFQLLRIEEKAYRFLWSFHHIILDGWALPTVVAEALAIYRHLKDGAPLALQDPVPYRNFVAWNLRQDQAAAREFWRRKLAGFSSATSLRLERPTGPEMEPGTRLARRVRLSPEVTSRLRHGARSWRCTLSTLVQVAWAFLLRAYSGEGDVVFGVTIAGRPRTLPGADGIVGLCINTLPVRVRMKNGDRLPEMAADLMTQQIEREELGHSSLPEIQSVSEVPPGTPLFETIVVFENYPVAAGLTDSGDALAVHEFASFDRTNYPLSLVAVPGDQLELTLTADPDRFDGDSVARLIQRLTTILEELAAASHGQVARLDRLPAGEWRAIGEMNRTQIDWDLSVPLDARLEVLARERPDAVALVAPGGEGNVTWSALHSRVNGVAHLLRERGVQPDEPVGLCMERSVEMVVGLLAILKAGGAYVPLDPAYPAERLRWMVDDIRPRAVLTQTRWTPFFRGLPCEAIPLDHAPDTIPGAPSEGSVPRRHEAANLMYVIYTSGSTGRPKGAMNTHRSVLNRLLWMQQAYPLTPEDRILQKTPFSFDVSVWEFLWPLLCGARLVIAEPGGHQDPEYLIRIIREQAVTTIHFVPSMLRAFLEAPGVEQCVSLRRVICSGEALPPDLEARFFERLGAHAELHNLYGPTECAVDVTAWACAPASSPRDTVPIGRPIANTEIHLLDGRHRPVPVGVPGELCIGGLNVGRGYWRAPVLTAAKFIPDPFSTRPGARLYRSGDLARRREDGVIEFLGRLDFQVKVRGFRIELQEIEARLAEVPGIRECAVIAENEEAERRLIAYVCALDPAPDAAALRRALRQHLPEFMVPAAFVFLAKLPLSANGKLDRRALPSPGARAHGEEPAIPQTEAEQNIAGAWREVLRIERVGLHDNFFEIGGNSLLLLPVQYRLQRLFGRPIPMTMLFRAPTVQSLAALLMAEGDADGTEQKPESTTRGKRAAQVSRLREARMGIRAGNPREDPTDE